ncbi:MAG TPA: hypothetical protein PKZ07_19865, partial [Sedimentisphaerales bacterium]|nr:hypothetical protein [Sedimentisphaerales bacterium]
MGCPESAWVDLDAAVLEPPEVSPHRPVGQKRADTLLVDPAVKRHSILTPFGHRKMTPHLFMPV